LSNITSKRDYNDCNKKALKTFSKIYDVMLFLDRSGYLDSHIKSHKDCVFTCVDKWLFGLWRLQIIGYCRQCFDWRYDLSLRSTTYRTFRASGFLDSRRGKIDKCSS
jgi:hypothetical protein